jgi:hypothetical protein
MKRRLVTLVKAINGLVGGALFGWCMALLHTKWLGIPSTGITVVYATLCGSIGMGMALGHKRVEWVYYWMMEGEPFDPPGSRATNAKTVGPGLEEMGGAGPEAAKLGATEASDSSQSRTYGPESLPRA